MYCMLFTNQYMLFLMPTDLAFDSIDHRFLKNTIVRFLRKCNYTDTLFHKQMPTENLSTILNQNEIHYISCMKVYVLVGFFQSFVLRI